MGISSFPLADIPGTLRLDGSPPLYYLMLHVWMARFRDAEAATHVLSLIFALAAIPVGLMGRLEPVRARAPAGSWPGCSRSIRS